MANRLKPLGLGSVRTDDRRSVGRCHGGRSGAGHSQVQIWREWRQAGPAVNPNTTRAFDGRPLRVEQPHAEFLPGESLSLYATPRGFARERIGLIMPTSLCAGEIAKMIARRLNSETGARDHQRLFALRCPRLAHTEGCGNSAGVSEEILLRTMTNHLRHPSVQTALLLEHGCEKTHNDAMRNFIETSGFKPDEFGWASVQLDGGIDRVAHKVSEYFRNALPPPKRKEITGLEYLRVGFVSEGRLPTNLAEAISILMGRIVTQRGTAVLSENSMNQFPIQSGRSSLDYAQTWQAGGLHIMHTPTDNLAEITSGLAATGVELMVAFANQSPIQSHPIVPVLQIGLSQGRPWEKDLDLTIDPAVPAKEVAAALWPLILQIYSGFALPKLFTSGNTNFQVTRGLWGVSL